MERFLLIIPPAGSLLAMLFAYFFHRSTMKESEGDEKMVSIAASVRKGAMAYLKQQYKAVILFFLFAFIFISFLSYVLKVQSPWTPFAFLSGGFFSGLAGFIGMRAATSASARTANAAKRSLNDALKIAFRSGAVMGLIVVGLGLLDISIWFYVLGHIYGDNFHIITTTMLSFGMGASSQALFARVGGGIFTKAADVGADLVGKVEANIPEDDPRNPAVIADNVGDNVGDVAGMGADLYESYCGSILSAAALGAAASYSMFHNAYAFNLVVLPMLLAGIGVIASIIGIFGVKTKENATQKDLMNSLSNGVNLSSVLIVVVSFFAIRYMLSGTKVSYWGIWLAMITGLSAGIIIGKITEFFTSFAYRPTQYIASQSNTGPATVILAGIGESMISTGFTVLTISAGIVLSYLFSVGFKPSPENVPLGLYGIAVAAVGMLSTLGITLATDAYGPIADNAGGNAQMSGQDPVVRQRTDSLDALGNTTAATGKGFAIGSAALTALALLASFLEEIKIALERIADKSGGFITIASTQFDKAAIEKMHIMDIMNYFSVHLLDFRVISGVFIGSMLPFLFSGLTINAVGRAAGKMVEEVRRQFREIKGLVEGTAEADYESCVRISALAAEKEMLLPALLAVITPVIVGMLLGVGGVLGLLAGAIGSGFVLAVMMANAGGAWDNAKKFVEEGNFGGKGSNNHKAAVIGDTVGDPLKDTAGPSINILIKLMSMVAIVTAGLIVGYSFFKPF